MKHRKTIARRSLLLGLCTMPLAACGDKTTIYGLDIDTWKKAARIAVGIDEQPGVTLEQAAAIPYSSIGYRVGSAAERMLILASDTGGELLWTSSEHRALSTRGGRVVKSVRFDWDLTDTQFPHGDPAASDLLAEDIPPSLRLCDFQDLGQYGVTIASAFVRRGPESITILGQTLPTIAVVETCKCQALDWEFQNIFWVDEESKFVWRSTQTIHPKMDALTIEVLRPPAST